MLSDGQHVRDSSAEGGWRWEQKGEQDEKTNSNETTAAQGLVLFIPLVDGVFIQDTTAEGGWKFIKCSIC